MQQNEWKAIPAAVLNFCMQQNEWKAISTAVLNFRMQQNEWNAISTAVGPPPGIAKRKSLGATKSSNLKRQAIQLDEALNWNLMNFEKPKILANPIISLKHCIHRYYVSLGKCP